MNQEYNYEIEFHNNKIKKVTEEEFKELNKHLIKKIKILKFDKVENGIMPMLYHYTKKLNKYFVEDYLGYKDVEEIEILTNEIKIIDEGTFEDWYNLKKLNFQIQLKKLNPMLSIIAIPLKK